MALTPEANEGPISNPDRPPSSSRRPRRSRHRRACRLTASAPVRRRSRRLPRHAGHLRAAGTGGRQSGDTRQPGHATGRRRSITRGLALPTPGSPGRRRWSGEHCQCPSRRAADGGRRHQAAPACGRHRPGRTGSWASPLWGGPVDLPEAIELAPVADEAARRAVTRPGRPRHPPGRSGRGTAASRHGQRTDDAGASVAPRGRRIPRALGAEGAADPDRPREPGAGPRPDAATVLTDPRPVAMPGTEPGEPYREPRVPGRPQRVDRHHRGHRRPAGPRPPPAAPRDPAPAPVTRGWSRPPSLLASSAGADRLRDGLRRWYGTAQG